jgi:hypothetical protein
MEPRYVDLRKCRVGTEKLEPRIAPTILLFNAAGNTPNGEASTRSGFAATEVQPASAVGTHEISGALIKIN